MFRLKQCFVGLVRSLSQCPCLLCVSASLSFYPYPSVSYPIIPAGVLEMFLGSSCHVIVFSQAGILEEMIDDTLDVSNEEGLEEDADSEIDKILFELTAGRVIFPYLIFPLPHCSMFSRSLCDGMVM